MADLWKIRREMKRLGDQLRMLPEAIWEPWAQKRHDAMVAKGLPTHEGNVQLSPKVALVLIYQPNTIAQSVIDTCAFLQSSGYSPLVVSNQPISDTDMMRLAPHVWRVLIRPNFGYDFGGYRDGILSLAAWGIKPSHLLVLNDSVWFPLQANTQTIAQLEGQNAALCGPILRTLRGPHFIESYLFLMSGDALETDAIQSFWRTFALSSNKYKVIRRGERGLSKAFLDAGLPVKSVYSGDQFLDTIRQEPTATLLKTLRYAAFPNQADEHQKTNLLQCFEDTDAWHARALDFIADILTRGHFYGHFPYASVKLLGFPILKKGRDRNYALWREAYAAAVDDNALAPPQNTMWSEIKHSVSGSPQTTNDTHPTIKGVT
jgi:hypothetical protein